LITVGALNDEESIAANQMLETVQDILISCVATTSELSKGRDFPYKIRLVGSESYVGLVLQDILYRRFGFRRIAIFSTVDYYSSHSLYSLLNGEVGNFEVLGSYVLEPGAVDYLLEISHAKHTGALVFVFLTNPETTATLIVEAKQSGLLKEGTIVFCHDLAISTETVDLVSALDPSKDPDYYFKGVVGFKYRPLKSATESAVGISFLERWVQNQNTLSPTCSQEVVSAMIV
jgi:hypothetical protein